MRRLCLALLLSIAACQPVPHPFADAAQRPDTPALSPPDSAGIVVLPITGAPAPVAGQLAEAMAKALRDADVPASTTAQNRHSYRLIGSVSQTPMDTGRSAVTVAWQLETAAGKTLGRPTKTVETTQARWRSGDAALTATLATAAAPAIVALVEGDAPMPASGVDPVVVVRAVTGAPGDGGSTLAQAIGSALQRANVEIAATPSGTMSFVLSGRVLVSPAAEGKQQVKISWVLARPDGTEVGLVKQENAVPAGSLDGAWGDVAYAVATAAVPGITTLIDRVSGAAPGG